MENQGISLAKADSVPTAPVVLITGALTGIGRATAFAFARERAKLVISGRRKAAGEELVVELRKIGADAEFRVADVRDDTSVQALVDYTIERFGRLDVAINNAGTEGQPGPIAGQTVESYEATFNTNVLGTLISMKHEIRVMQPQRSGSVINISSAYGKVGAAGASVYVASKHAVEGLTKSAALEMAPFGIRVNAVAPGPIDTGMLDRFTGDAAGKEWMASTIPLKRVGTAEEIASAILFVASPSSSYLTGQSIGIDGGRLA
jgi:NAD(P)-dependent dehydrogenase (short-subunit alcohol dehydrogenase family)